MWPWPPDAYAAPVQDFLVAVIPSAGVLLLFVLGIRALVHADRRERIAQARFDEARERESREVPDGPDPDIAQ